MARHRDPNTGQFLSSEDMDMAQYNDIEQWTFSAVLAFDGEEDNDFSDRSVEILDIDDITDRRREAADLVHAYVEVTASGQSSVDVKGYWLQFQTGGTGLTPNLTTTETDSIEASDSLDAIGAPFVNRSEDEDFPIQHQTWSYDTVADPVFFPRNEIELVGELENLSDDDDLTVNVNGYMVFGLRDQEGTGR